MTRRIVVSTYVTLDGIYEDPGGAEDFEHGGWSVPYFNDEADEYAREQLWAADALLLGRKTYEEFAANWPAQEEAEGDFGVRMNTLPKHVVSRTLTEPLSWNNARLVHGDVDARIRELKQESGQDLLMYSSVGLMRSLLGAGLVDEVRLWVHPVALGTGRRVFPERSARTTLTLEDVTRLSTGVAILSYRPT